MQWMAKEDKQYAPSNLCQPRREPSYRIWQPMDNVDVSQQTMYRLHMQQGAEKEMEILRWRHNM